MLKDNMRPEDYIYKLIKNKIIKKELFPNCQIVESQLAEDTGISRTPIRAALKRLSYEGVVNNIPNRGTFVANPTLDEIRAVYDCKILLESAAIKLACDHITQDQLNQLDELMERQVETHVRKDLYQFIKINAEFHMTIAKASKNMFYEKYINELIERSDVYLIFYDRFMVTSIENSDALKEHLKILNLLKARDSDGCAEAIVRHNQITFNQLCLNGIIP